MNSNTTSLMFLGHGNPMNAIEENEFVEGFRTIASTLPRPEAVLCISAHWETLGTFITAMDTPRTIHDFGGFPKELYEIQYLAPGNPTLAKKIIDSVSSSEIKPNSNWGLDHGTWTVLKHFFPNADVPVLQLSLNRNLSTNQHFILAQQLKDLRKEGVMIVGSGNIVHNLGQIAWNKINDEYAHEWASDANERIKQFIVQANYEALLAYSQDRAFQLSIPTPEHFLPLLYILALKEPTDTMKFFNDKIIAGSLSMTSLICS